MLSLPNLFLSTHAAYAVDSTVPGTQMHSHTLCCFSSLSSAQHYIFSSPTRFLTRACPVDINVLCALGPLVDLSKFMFAEAQPWYEEDGTAKLVGGQGNCEVSLFFPYNLQHALNWAGHRRTPLFDLTMTHKEAIMGHFISSGFPQRQGATSNVALSLLDVLAFVSPKLTKQ